MNKPRPSESKEKLPVESLINFMERNGIFCICEDGKEFELTECCDHYFSVILTPQELWKLGAEMMQMANEKVNKDSVKIPIPPLPLSSVKGKN